MSGDTRMAIFDYTADDGTGRVVVGQITAETLVLARRELTRRGWLVLTMELTAVGAPGSKPAEWTRGSDWRSISRRAPSPLTVTTSLRALAEEQPSGSHGAALLALAEQLDRGIPLADGVATVGPRLSRELRTLLLVPVREGRVDLLLQEYLEMTRRSVDARRAVTVALAIPLVVVVFSGAFLIGFSQVAMTWFDSVLGTFEEVTAGTEPLDVMRLYRLFSAACGVLGTAMVVIPSATWLLGWLPGGRQLRRWLGRSVPMIGPIYRDASRSNACQLLAILTELDVELSQAFQALAVATDDSRLAVAARLVSERLHQGFSPVEALKQAGGWPDDITSAFRWIAQPDAFVEALQAVGEIYAARSRAQAQFLAWLAEPLAMLLLLILVLLTAWTVFMPLVNMLDWLS